MKTKKILILVLAIFFGSTYIGCSCSNDNEDSSSSQSIEHNDNISTNSNNAETTSSTIVDKRSNEEKMIDLVNNYNVIGTNGYDYSLVQKETKSTTITNSHTIELRLDNSSINIKGTKKDSIKTLSTDLSQGQYVESTTTYYYADNKLGYYVDSTLNWKDYSLNDFVNINIADFAFEYSDLKDNISISKFGKYFVLTINIDDSQSGNFLGLKENVKNLKFEIKTNSNYDTLISFEMSYSQTLTTTEYSFTPYTSSVNITIPN